MRGIAEFTGRSCNLVENVSLKHERSLQISGNCSGPDVTVDQAIHQKEYVARYVSDENHWPPPPYTFATIANGNMT